MKAEDGDSSDSVDYASDDETSAYERRALKLKRRRVRAFLSEFKDDDVTKASDLIPKQSPPPKPIKRNRSYKKRFSTPKVVFHPRKSKRLSLKTVDYEGLENFKEPPTHRRKSVNGRRYRRHRIESEPHDVEFNPDALSGTVCYSNQKVYSQAGTTCHQCRTENLCLQGFTPPPWASSQSDVIRPDRQKTIDKKSHCYSPYCRGVRGMFCGYCLLQRYGEDVAVVLRDPNWKCPPCRKICNCSICRRSYGKEPTGQLFPHVTEKGFNNVLEYLSQIGDDKLEDAAEADNESESDEKENEAIEPPVKRIKYGLEPVVMLRRLDLPFDEDELFKGF